MHTNDPNPNTNDTGADGEAQLPEGNGAPSDLDSGDRELFNQFKQDLTKALPERTPDGQDPADDELDDAERDEIEAARLAAAEKAQGGKSAAAAAAQAGKGQGGAAGGEQPAKDPTVEAEVKALKLSKGAADRFHEMAAGLKEKDVLLQEKDARLAEAEPMIQLATEFNRNLEASRATPEQVGRMFAITHAINTNDPDLLRRAHDALQGEVDALAARLGLRTQAHNPLDSDPVLKGKVERGEIDEQDALAWIADRQTAKLQEQARQTTENTVQAEALKRAALQEVTDTFAAYRATDKRMEEKLELMADELREIQATMPPERWKDAAVRAYERVTRVVDRYAAAAVPSQPAAPAPVQQPLRTGRVPGRGGGASGGPQGNGLRRDVTDPLAAMREAMSEAYAAEKEGRGSGF